MKTVVAKKLDVTTVTSNLLLASVVLLASAPVVLGDQLVSIASDVVSQAAILSEEFSIFLQRLLS